MSFVHDYAMIPQKVDFTFTASAEISPLKYFSFQVAATCTSGTIDDCIDPRARLFDESDRYATTGKVIVVVSNDLIFAT